MRRGIGALAALALSAAVVTAAPQTAEAQTVQRVGATPQGIVGGALLGAELVILIEGAAGVRSPGILLGTGAAGLVAGGVGGFVLDFWIDNAPPIGSGGTNPNPPALAMVSTGLLVAGLGLVIPTAIVFVGSTMYRPEETGRNAEDNTQDQELLEESSDRPRAPGATPTPAGTPATPSATPNAPSGGSSGPTSRLHRRNLRRNTRFSGLGYFGPTFRAWGTNFRLELPTAAMIPSYTLEERRQFNLPDMQELRFNLLSMRY